MAPKLARTRASESKLIFFAFHHEVREFGCAVEQELMRHSWRNSHDIPRREFYSRATLNRAVAFLMRRNGLAIQIRSADE